MSALHPKMVLSSAVHSRRRSPQEAAAVDVDVRYLQSTGAALRPAVLHSRLGVSHSAIHRRSSVRSGVLERRVMAGRTRLVGEMGGRFRLVPAVHLFLVRHRQVLLLRRFNTGYEDGNYSVPAGHLDGGESVSAAMAREAWEETGVSVDARDLEIVHVMHRAPAGAGGERIDFFLTAARWAGQPAIMEPDKCDDLSWRSLDDLPPNTIPYVAAALTAYRSSQAFSEFGWQPMPEPSVVGT